MTEEQTLDCLLALKAVFPNGDRGLEEAQIIARQNVWQGAMAKWHYRSAMEAIGQVALSCKYAYPSLAEVYEAYQECNRPRPELVSVSNALPAPGHTTASPEEIRSACAAAIATVEASAVIPSVRFQRERADLARVEKELEGRKGIATPPERIRQHHEEWCAYPHPDSLMCPKPGISGGPVEMVRDGKSSAAEGGTP